MKAIDAAYASADRAVASPAALSAWMNFLKGMAIFGIVAFHFFNDHVSAIMAAMGTTTTGIEGLLRTAQSAFLQATHIGSQGIHVFFFLSGFGLALSETKKSLNAGQFMIRRLSRIYPAFVVALLFVALLQLMTGQQKADASYFQAMLVNFVLLRNYSSDWIRTLNGDWWFVAAIVPMYVMHLVLRKYYFAKPLRWLFIAFAVSFAYKVALVVAASQGVIFFDAGQLNPYTAFFLNYWWIFVAGMIMQRLNAFGRLAALRPSGLFALFLIGMLCEVIGVILGYSTIGRVFNDDPFAIAQLCLLSVLAMLIVSKIPRLHELVGAIGASSYGMYLIHHPISKTIVYFFPGISSLPEVILIFVAYFAICFFLGRIIESVAGRLADRLLKPA
jgi:peptidoglycan/LPS O-acetylase OafA/YrhL